MAPVFDPHQRATLEAVTDRIIPADRDPGARQAGVVDYIENTLGTYEAEHAPLYVDGIQELDRLARERFGSEAFVRLRAEQHDQILAYLEKERSPFFALLVEHTMQGFYGDPRHGGNRNGVSWKMIGFPGPSHPKGYQPPFGWYDDNIPDAFDPDKSEATNMPRNNPVDVCIVGAGASGLVAAKELSEAGMSVVVLERGPWYKRTDFLEDEILFKHRHFLWPTVKEEPRTWRPDDRTPAERLSHEVQLFSNAMCVGAGTVHYSGLSWRFHESDFRVKSADGQVAGASIEDWPVNYDEMEPYYEKAEWTIGISGQGWANPFDPPRKRDFPMPALARNSAGAILEKGGKALGLHPFPTPMAILSRPYDGRPACVHKGFCSGYGCTVGAKSSTLEALVPKALATGRCEIRPHAMSREISVDNDGRATGVAYFDQKGDEQFQPARIVLLAAGGVETPRLLLLSQSSRFPQGLANSSGLVGKNLMLHAPGAITIAIFPEPLEGHQGAPSTRVLQDFYETDSKRGFIRGGFMHPRAHGGDPIDYALRDVHGARWGLKHKESMRSTYRYYLHSHSTGESLPVESNQVDLDPEVRDRFGLPVARVTYTSHENDVRLATFLAARSREIFEAAGASRVISPETRARKLHNHQMGSCRMGNDPKSSVVDKWCRSHDVRNLFIIDASVFVTSGGLNPALTIQANAFRVCDHMVAEASRGNLA